MIETKKALISAIAAMSPSDFSLLAKSVQNNPILLKYSNSQVAPLYDQDVDIRDFLFNLGFVPDTDGFKFLRTAVGILLYESEFTVQKITYVYDEVARRYSLSRSAIINSVRTAINNLYNKNYRAFSDFKSIWELPKPKEFFAYAVEKLS